MDFGLIPSGMPEIKWKINNTIIHTTPLSVAKGETFVDEDGSHGQLICYFMA
jgi:hypothetical protein